MTDTGQATCVIQMYIFVPPPDILVYFTGAWYLKIKDFTQSVWYNSLDHPECMRAMDGVDYQAIRTTEFKICGVCNVQKMFTHCYSTALLQCHSFRRKYCI